MSTELDCYGMTPEERAEFEREFHRESLMPAPSGCYASLFTHGAAKGWAACAKLYRERIATRDGVIEIVRDADRMKRARIKELEAENERLRADAARLDWVVEAIGSEHHVKIGSRNPNEWDAADAPFEVWYWRATRFYSVCGKTPRAAIDAAMKGGE